MRMCGGAKALGEAGLALAATLIMLVGASMLVTGAFVMTDLHARAGLNREGAVRASHVAEAGLTHTVAVLRAELQNTDFTRLLRGSDNVAGTTDDGYVWGYGLSSELAIPPAGLAANWGGGTSGGRYYVRVRDDPAETDGDSTTDSNGRILLRCRGQAPDGAVAEIEAIVGMTVLSGFVVDGALAIPGNPVISGTCGSVHANDTLWIKGTTQVQHYAASSDSVMVGPEKLQNLSGNPIAPRHRQPHQDVPLLDPSAYCAPANYAKIDYVLQSDGYVFVVRENKRYSAQNGPQFGWKYSAGPVVWDASEDRVWPGTFCVEGSAKLSGNPGTPTNPIPLSIIASGSIEISGNPFFTSDHPDGIALMAGGDLSISGNPGVFTGNNFSGLLYAGSQCKFSGESVIDGQIMCKDRADPRGAVNRADENLISGNARIRFNCRSNSLNQRQILFWYPRYGS